MRAHLINVNNPTGSIYGNGNYEFLRVDRVQSALVAFKTSKINFYGPSFQSDTGIGIASGDTKVMLVRVPNYSNVTVNGTLTGSPWNGLKNGVIAFRVMGSLTGGGKISADALGFGAQTGYGAGKEGNPESQIGGGGSYGTAGAWGTNGSGSIYGSASLSNVYFGSGGGNSKKWIGCDQAGNNCWDYTAGGTGGAGGGILFVSGNTINFSGNLTALGSPQICGSAGCNGGAGSGGSIRIEAFDIESLHTNALNGISSNTQGNGRIATYYQQTLSTFISNPASYIGRLDVAPTATPTPTPAGTPFNALSGTGQDGDLFIDTLATYNLNSSPSQNTQRQNLGCADSVAYNISGLTSTTATLASIPTNVCLSAGDEILLISDYQGANSANVGKYEFLRVGSISGNAVTFLSAKTNFYGSIAGTDNNIGSDPRVMMVRVPNYRTVTINGTLTGSAYNGSNQSGIVVFRANTLTGQNSGKISADALGFGGHAGYGAGTEGFPASQKGGGGSYGTTGASGTNGSGSIYGSASLSNLYFGSGGGNSENWIGCDQNGNNCKDYTGGGAGGSSGGILFVSGNTINFQGSLTARGASQICGNVGCNGGAGSGGSIRIEGNSVTLGTASVDGGSTAAAGGKGRIAIYYHDSLTGYTCTIANSCYSLNTSLTLTPTPTGTLPTPTASPTPTTPGTGVTAYYYADPNHVHAVTSLSSNFSYTYDANGNMNHLQANHLWVLSYDVENHMVSQTSDFFGFTGTYLYDGDGVRVGQLVNGVATYYFFGGAYEVTVSSGNTSVRKYYSIAGQMVAMDDGSAAGLQYFLTDHLGSIVALISSSGTLNSQQRFYPSGKLRSIGAINQTDFGYTGQRYMTGTRLLDYKSRFSDPYLNRFLQPDSIIPNLYNPQSLNRYSYVGNNSINRTDPSGHKYCDGKDSSKGCEGITTNDLRDLLSYQYNWKLTDKWSKKDVEAITKAGEQIQSFVNNLTNGNGLAWMNRYMGGVSFEHGGLPGGYSFVTGNTVHLSDAYGEFSTIVHELGHVWDNNSVAGPVCLGFGGCIGSSISQMRQFTSEHCWAEFCGGGNADLLATRLGGSPSGIRFFNGTSSIPEKYMWNGYGDRGTAEYFADAFRYMVINRTDLIPRQSIVVNIMQDFITIEASTLP